MHAAIFVWGVSGGAMATIGADLTTGFDSLGCAIDVLRCDRAQPAFELRYPERARHICLAQRSRFSPMRLAGYLRRENPDFLLTVGSLQNAVGIVGSAVARYDGTLLLNEHAALSAEALEHAGEVLFRMMPWFARKHYRRASRVVAVSKAVQHDLVEIGVPEGKIACIGNPVNLDRISELAVESLPDDVLEFVNTGAPVFVSVGRLAREKNHRLLVDAFAEVRKIVGQGRLVIAGDGPLRGAVQERIREHGLEHDVLLAGFLSNPHPLIANADVLVSPSEREGFGLVLVEAMALGTPVIATDCLGGVREVLDGGTAGYLVPPNDVAALCTAMTTLVDDDRLRHCLIDAGRRRAKDFDPTAVAGEWLRLVGAL